MNEKQKLVLVFGMVLFLGMGLYPPWHIERSNRFVATGPKDITTILGLRDGHAYRWLWSRPFAKHSRNGEALSNWALDTRRLHVQWAMVAVFTGGLIVIFGDTKKPNAPGKEAES